MTTTMFYLIHTYSLRGKWRMLKLTRLTLYFPKFVVVLLSVLIFRTSLSSLRYTLSMTSCLLKINACYCFLFQQRWAGIVGLEADRIFHLMIQAPKLVRSFILVYILKINSWPPKFLYFSRWPPSLKDGTAFLPMAYKRNVVKCKMFQWLMCSWREWGN